MKPVFRSKRAVSFVEVVVTMVLLAIVIFSAFNYYASVVSFAVKAENYNAATEFLAETLNVLLSYAYNDAVFSSGTHTVATEAWLDLAGYPLKEKYGAVRQYTVSPEINWDPNPDLVGSTTNGYKEIVASITWNDGTARTLTLSVRKTK